MNESTSASIMGRRDSSTAIVIEPEDTVSNGLPFLSLSLQLTKNKRQPRIRLMVLTFITVSIIFFINSVASHKAINDKKYADVHHVLRCKICSLGRCDK